MLTDDELKTQIHELVEQIRQYDREDTRAAIFDFCMRVIDDRAEPVKLTISDLNEIRNLAIGEIQKLPVPAFIDEKIIDSQQRVSFSYLLALSSFLKKRNLIKYLILLDTQQPFCFSLHEE